MFLTFYNPKGLNLILCTSYCSLLPQFSAPKKAPNSRNKIELPALQIEIDFLFDFTKS